MEGSKPLEKALQRKVLADLNALTNTFKYKAQAVAIRGIPDVMVCCLGFFIALELKRCAKESATLLQEYTLKEINNAGGVGLIVNPDNWGTIYDLISLLSKGEKSAQNELRILALGSISKIAGKAG